MTVTRPLALPLLITLLCAVPAGAEPPPEPPRIELPEDSRWLSFVRLVEGRWKARTRIPPGGDEERKKLFARCTQDAWQLARPGLLTGRGAPCAVLLGGDEKRTKAARRAREEYARRFGALLVAPGEGDYRACIAEVEAGGDRALLEHCALAIRPRAALLVSLDDEDRFQTWFRACKKSILSDVQVTAGEAPGLAAAPDPLQEDHARHCLRTLPTFYEVRWMKKLSEYWTPEEQKRLYLRSRQLGRD